MASRLCLGISWVIHSSSVGHSAKSGLAIWPGQAARFAAAGDQYFLSSKQNSLTPSTDPSEKTETSHWI